MKNSQYVTEYLDACAELHACGVEQMRLSFDFEVWRATLDRTTGLHDRCIADGWTIAEMDAAYNRRFGTNIKRPR